MDPAWRKVFFADSTGFGGAGAEAGVEAGGGEGSFFLVNEWLTRCRKLGLLGDLADEDEPRRVLPVDATVADTPPSGTSSRSLVMGLREKICGRWSFSEVIRRPRPVKSTLLLRSAGSLGGTSTSL